MLKGAAGAVVLSACSPEDEDRGRLYSIVVTTADGVLVVDQDGRRARPPTAVAAATGDWGRVVAAAADGPDTVVALEDPLSGQRVASVRLRDRLEPRIVSPDGTLIASVTPGGAGIYGLHNPGGRERTTIVVSSPDRERGRLDLPGNLEPEAFSPDGSRLFVLDFRPAGKPSVFRVGVVDLATQAFRPISEDMRVHRIHRIQERGKLWAICSLPETATAYVHCIDLEAGSARRVDLPAPFGQGRAGVHTIALSGDRLAAVHSLSSSVADIDPDGFVVRGVTAFGPAGQDGKPVAAFTSSGRLLINVDRKVFGSEHELVTPGEARGLVVSGGEVWVGHPDGVVHYDLASGAELGRVKVPGMYVLKRVSIR